MTLVSSIIKDAYRESNLKAIGTTPSTEEYNEALPRLQSLVSSMLGNEAGVKLDVIPIGRNNISQPSGWPYYDGLPNQDWYVPLNKRLALNLTTDVTVALHPLPQDGSRLAVSDISGNLGTYNFTINGNGRTIEGVDSLILNTSDIKQEWFYRDDTGNWARISNLELTDEFPYPVEFDDMFIILLAARLNSRNGVELDAGSQMILSRSRKQFQARYQQNIPIDSEDALLRLSDIGNRRDYRYYGSDQNIFNSGYPFRY